jgi:hypothetical protein
VTDPTARLAVFASGGGSNLQAILDHFDALGATAPGVVALVLSDRKAAGALERARARGIPAVWLPKDRQREMEATLREHGITHIALAGYLRLIPPAVVRAYEGRMVNVHPALLPGFGGPGMYGHHVHEAVVRAGARTSGPDGALRERAVRRGRDHRAAGSPRPPGRHTRIPRRPRAESRARPLPPHRRRSLRRTTRDGPVSPASRIPHPASRIPHPASRISHHPRIAVNA